MKIPKPTSANAIGRPSRLQTAVLAARSVLIGLCLSAHSISAQTLMAFNFNEGTGTTVTSADGKLTGTFVGMPSFSTDTPSGLAGDFSLQFAAGQRVTVPDPTKVLVLDTANPSFTIQAWLKFVTPSGRSVFFYNDGPGGAVSASVFTDRTAFVTTLGVLDQQSAAVIPDDGKWHHLAVVHEDKKEFRFYIDGLLADTVPYTSSVIFTRTNQIFYIGAENTGLLQYDGLLDRLRYSKGILATNQLDSKGIPPDAKPTGAAYPPPTGGWAYILDGDKDSPGSARSGFESLDGTWGHDNGSDFWDGSKIGGTFTMDAYAVGNAPGGVMTITESGVTFLRMQDCGNPSQYGFPDPNSNRKIYFGRDITAQGAPDALLDDGVTLTFRARIPMPGNAMEPLDQIHADGQSAAGPTPYPADGDGYLISDGGKGNVGIKQLNGGIISFALTVTNDTFGGDPAGTKADFAGLTMNRFNGNTIANAVDFDDAGEFRGVELDPGQWHEFWITIKADTNGMGTHEVSVYMDGSTQATTNLIVTAGDGNDYSGVSYLTIGGSRTVESWALDLDFVAYRIGAEAPSGSAVPPRFTSIVLQADKVVITWTGGGTLQTSPELPGTWTDVTGAASPAMVTVADPKRFYRIRK